MTDHINHDGLDNQRSNLRSVVQRQNSANQRKRSHVNGLATSSRFKGVGWHGQQCIWRADIQVNGVRKCLGTFASETDAARAYNKAAVEAFGDYACLNEVD